MKNVFICTEKLVVYEALMELGAAAGESREWCGGLWADLLEEERLYEEFVYYLKRRELRDTVRAEGYTLIDLFIWHMGRDNLLRDTGKNTAACNKDRMVLHAFHTMRQLQREPDVWKKRLSGDQGMDRTM